MSCLVEGGDDAADAETLSHPNVVDSRGLIVDGVGHGLPVMLEVVLSGLVPDETTVSVVHWELPIAHRASVDGTFP